MGASQQPSAAQSEQDLSEALDVDPDEYEWVRGQLESAGIQLTSARLDDAADDDDGDGESGEDDGENGPDNAGAWKDPSEGGALGELLRALEDDGGGGGGGDGDDDDDDGEQALLDRVEALLARLEAPEISLPGPDGDAPLHLAALYGLEKVAARLLEAGADPSVENPEDKTLALHDAAAGGYDGIVDLLLGASPKTAVDAHDEDGDTPLHCAARGGHLSTVLRLLKAGADPTAANEKGCTPRDESDDEKVRALLERVAERKGEDEAGGGGGGDKAATTT